MEGMSKRDLKQAAWLALGLVLVVLSLTTGFLEAIVFPLAIGAFGILAFLTMIALTIYLRKYHADHPYIPYAGQWAHVLCRECEKRGSEYSIEMTTGTAVESWRFGKYFRHFKREYRAHCSRGHEWTFDPILEMNEQDGKEKKPRYKEGARALARRIGRMRSLRELVHKFYSGDL